MDLILWRHAEAEDWQETDEGGGDDLSRRLTARGEKQAARMAAWLDRMLPDGVRIWSSPAVRAEQTVLALGRRYRLHPDLAPDGTPQGLLEVVQWPDARHASLVVGHQPTLGRVVAELLGMRAGECSVRKGAVWWLRRRQRHDTWQTILLAVQTPELL
ncbi:sixA: phosphohistidine phosphatase SixA [Tepidimonas thermarum]|uniref:SixA: phosphohistidine phosphatase SixA n=1 Tax=Tepidimonas thermarum TaxID=335431 RepID=A0A554X8V6_9BURK|nr:histidine phosphatase family protein [Tepidimonas thermarum]TSE32251.1 sixA: phosphohistidine phosphatase SixA [Tepidimonas thermarum]